MLIPGNRTLLFLLLIIIFPLFWRREDTFFFLFEYQFDHSHNLTQQTEQDTDLVC